MINLRVCLGVVLLCAASWEASMAQSEKKKERSEAAPVSPVLIGKTRYEAVASSPTGELAAFEGFTDKKLWTLPLYHRHVAANMETDKQWVFLTALAKVDDGTLRAEDERGFVYHVDVKNRSAKISSWPVGLRVESTSPLKVELTIVNTFDRVIEFDKPSIVEGGDLSNDLFRVIADGKTVAYKGMMAKRAKPATFSKLAPGDNYKVTVDLSQAYPLPAGVKKVAVRFSSPNHFSKDDFRMESAPLIVGPF